MNIKFVCQTTGYTLYFYLDYHSGFATLLNIEWDFKHPKPLVILLKDAQTELSKKGFKHVKHAVTKSDYNNHLKEKTSWSICELHDESFDLVCTIDKLAENIALGLGFI